MPKSIKETHAFSVGLSLAACFSVLTIMWPSLVHAKEKTPVNKVKNAQPARPPALPPAPSTDQQVAEMAAAYQAGRIATTAREHQNALAQYQRAWDIAKLLLPLTDPSAGLLAKALGLAHVSLNQDKQAEPFLRQALAAYQTRSPQNPGELAELAEQLAELSKRTANREDEIQWRREEIRQRRLVLNAALADQTSDESTRINASLNLALAVISLSDRGAVQEGLDHLEAASAALETIPQAREHNIAIISAMCSITQLSDVAKAMSLAQKGYRLSQELSIGPQRSLWMGEFQLSEANAARELGRFQQARTLYESALGLILSTPEGPKRNALASRIYSGLITEAKLRKDYENLAKWSLLGVEASPTGSERAGHLTSLAAAEIKLNKTEDAKRHADEARVLSYAHWDNTNPASIIARLELSGIYADLGDVDAALALYDAASSAAPALKSDVFSEFNMIYLTAGIQTLVAANQAERAYQSLSNAGQSLLAGPGTKFGVDNESRRIFNSYRYVFQRQMRVGWIAAQSSNTKP